MKNYNQQIAEFLKSDSPDGYLLLKHVFNQADKPEEFLMSVATQLGTPLAYKQDKNGALIHDITPTHKNECTQTSEGSKVLLESHTELAFHRYKPSFVILLCIRQDREKQAKTGCLSGRKIKEYLSDRSFDLLKQSEFKIAMDESYVIHYLGTLAHGRVFPLPDLVPVFSERPNGDLFLQFDRDLMTTDSSDHNNALLEIQEIISSLMTWIALEAGDLLIIDNNRAIHARTAFKAHYDGMDRLLKRVLVMDTKEFDTQEVQSVLELSESGHPIINFDFSPFIQK